MEELRWIKVKMQQVKSQESKYLYCFDVITYTTYLQRFTNRVFFIPKEKKRKKINENEKK